MGHQADEVRSVLPLGVVSVLQEEQKGTGDAVRVALQSIDEEEGVLLVVNGDGPLISGRTLVELVERHRAAGVGATVLVAELEAATGLGRVMEDAGVVRIVEEKDATEAEKEIRLVNLGLYAFELSEIRHALGLVGPENAHGELYLTDALEIIGRRSRAVTYRVRNLEEANLVNDRAQLALAEEILRRRIRTRICGWGDGEGPGQHAHRGERRDRRDTVILPGTFLRGETKIGSDCVIGPSADLLDTTVGDGALVNTRSGGAPRSGPGERGPYAYLRPGTVLGEVSKVGAYCELKNARVGAGSKVPHLSYVGDAEIGEGANLGAARSRRTTMGKTSTAPRLETASSPGSTRTL